jgi:hypothetical protein
LAASSRLEAREDCVVVDRNTWILEGTLGYRVILWEIVPFNNIANVCDYVVRVEMKTTKTSNNAVGDAG